MYFSDINGHTKKIIVSTFLASSVLKSMEFLLMLSFLPKLFVIVILFSKISRLKVLGFGNSKVNSGCILYTLIEVLHLSSFLPSVAAEAALTV